MTKRRWVVSILGVVAVAFLVFGGAAWRRVRAAQFLSALSHGSASAPAKAPALLERDLVIPGPGYDIRARLYRPAGGATAPGLVIAHGVHYRGIDEARLVPFARAIAATGRVVLTPELRDLTDYRITEQGTDVIASSVTWLSEQKGLIRGSKVGVLGFSFAGGLALVAAGRPALENRVEFVSSVGGHHDLARVLAFLISDRIETPSGPLTSPAHEYGLVVLLYQYLDAFVDEPERAIVGDALRHWLHEDREKARALAAECTTPKAKRLFALLDAGRLKELGPELEQLLAQRQAALRALSPRGKLRALNLPVYLLHGSADSVIPPCETDWAAVELEGRDHYALVSPLLEHVEVNRHAGLRDELALVEFMSHLL